MLGWGKSKWKTSQHGSLRAGSHRISGKMKIINRTISFRILKTKSARKKLTVTNLKVKKAGKWLGTDRRRSLTSSCKPTGRMITFISINALSRNWKEAILLSRRNRYLPSISLPRTNFDAIPWLSRRIFKWKNFLNHNLSVGRADYNYKYMIQQQGNTILLNYVFTWRATYSFRTIQTTARTMGQSNRKNRLIVLKKI